MSNFLITILIGNILFTPFHSDHLGGTNSVTDEAGQQVKYLDYKPYGETKVEEGSLAVKKKFTGKELDDSTGLYNNLARLYDPKIGRFVTADPIDFSDIGIRLAGGRDLQTFLMNPQNLNRYSYCLNNPLRYTDPDGLLTELFPGIKIPSNRKEGWSVNTRISNELLKKGESVREFTWSGNLFSKELYRKIANELITGQKLAESRKEKFNIVAHSWAAPAVVKVLKTLKLKIDNLITISGPTPGFGFKPEGVKNWTNIVSPLDPMGWGSLGTDAKQKLVPSIHLEDFNNPFISRIVTKSIVGNENRPRKEILNYEGK